MLESNDRGDNMEEKQALFFDFWDAVRLGFAFGLGFILCSSLFVIGGGIIFGVTLAVSS